MISGPLEEKVGLGAGCSVAGGLGFGVEIEAEVGSTTGKAGGALEVASSPPTARDEQAATANDSVSALIFERQDPRAPIAQAQEYIAAPLDPPRSRPIALLTADTRKPPSTPFDRAEPRGW